MNNNDFVKRILALQEEVKRLKTAKEKGSGLIKMVEQSLEIELEVSWIPSYVSLQTNIVLVNTWTENDVQPIVSLYYNGEMEKFRVFQFRRFAKSTSESKHQSEMGFAVQCGLFDQSDADNLPFGETTTMKVPLLLVSSAPLQVETEVIYDPPKG